MTVDLPAEQLAATLDTIAYEALAAARVIAPPVDAARVAAGLGLRVALDRRQSARGRYLRLAHADGQRRGSILIRPDPRPERLQWAIAHELGEHFSAELFTRLGADPRDGTASQREQLANDFAQRLLLPTDWFSADGERLGWDLTELKTQYETASHELIARRCLDLSPTVVISVWDQNQLSLRQSNLPGRPPPPSLDERRCREQVHHTGRPQQRDSAEGWIRAWPVHEADWKREIVRWEPALVEC